MFWSPCWSGAVLGGPTGLCRIGVCASAVFALGPTLGTMMGCVCPLWHGSNPELVPGHAAATVGLALGLIGTIQTASRLGPREQPTPFESPD